MINYINILLRFIAIQNKYMNANNRTSPVLQLCIEIAILHIILYSEFIIITNCNLNWNDI